jgi:hypothetical protein
MCIAYMKTKHRLLLVVTFTGICMAVGWTGTAAYADVTGSFAMSLSFVPSSCVSSSCEETLFTLDLHARLRLALALGGVRLQIEGLMGIPGSEFWIVDSQFPLGVTLIRNRDIFAVPFGRTRATTGERISTVIPPGEILFVRQETLVEYTAGGVTIGGLLVLEDVTFPSPTASRVRSYATRDQNFAAGFAFALEARTRAGTRIESQASLCLDPTRRRNIIHRSFAGRVCEGDSLGFTGTFLHLRDLYLWPGAISDHELVCRFQMGCALESEFGVRIDSFTLALSTAVNLHELLASGRLQLVELQGAWGPIRLGFTWNGTLALRRVDAQLSLLLASHPRSLTWTLSGTFLTDSEITRLKSSLTLKHTGSTLKADITFSTSAGIVRFTESNIGWMLTLKPVTVELSAHVTASGLQDVTLEAAVSF